MFQYYFLDNYLQANSSRERPSPSKTRIRRIQEKVEQTRADIAELEERWKKVKKLKRDASP